MSYAIYKTEAIILRVIPDREANVDIVLLTRELGKITVRAQGARKIESKHRMHISRYRHVTIDVVRGAHLWRLTGIHEHALHDIFGDHNYLRVFTRAATLAEHLIRGEESHPELFDFFVQLLEYSDQQIALGENLHEGLELFAVMGVLRHLGYWDFNDGASLDPEHLQQLVARKKQMVADINQALTMTHIF